MSQELPTLQYPEPNSIKGSGSKSAKKRFCSACNQETGYNFNNPLLGVPLCITCYDIYTFETFPVSETNEDFCRWCGAGEGELLLCDSCPKSFCSRCVRGNFGEAEFLRIANLPDRWSCFVCSPQALKDLIKRKGWATVKSTSADEKAAKKAKFDSVRPGLICYDVSRGRERIEIPVFNTVDSAPAPLDFVYVSKPVTGEGVTLTEEPSFLTCCSCTDQCRDPTRCECILNSGGRTYDMHGRLSSDNHTGIYECNFKCSCHVRKCKNRVVSRGPNQRLEVFRCEDPTKGWGVRCRDTILAGTYIADYIGEILLEADAETRGLCFCDEYLYTMDDYGRSVGCQKLSDLGIKASPFNIPKEEFVNCNVTSEEEMRKYIDSDLADLLVSKGAVKRALAIGKQVDAELVRNTADKGRKNNWQRKHLAAMKENWERATSQVTDRCVAEVEEQGDQFIVDACRYGSIGRFINHSCNPNLDKILVFCDNHDVRTPRVAFFTKDTIYANTELCYDYGYRPGNVEGKHRPCLCGAVNCRKTLY